MPKVETDTQTLKDELAALRERVERLEGILGDASDPAGARRLPGTVDREALRPVVAEAFRRMGIPLRPPTATPQEIQERIAQGGVLPEERLGNTILAKMRGYEE